MFPRKKLLESALVLDLNHKNGVKLGTETCLIMFTALNHVYSFWSNDLHALTMPLCVLVSINTPTCLKYLCERIVGGNGWLR